MFLQIFHCFSLSFCYNKYKWINIVLLSLVCTSFFGPTGALPRSRRRKSETFRAQYINAKEIKYATSHIYWSHKVFGSNMVTMYYVICLVFYSDTLVFAITCDIRIRAGTWNVGGKLPPDHLEIEDWLNISDPADMYVIG